MWPLQVQGETTTPRNLTDRAGRLQRHPGDVLFIFTDGLIEGVNEADLDNGEDRIAVRASLLFVEHGVVDGLALTVFSSIGGDPRLSVGPHHDMPGERGFATLLLDDFVRASVGF